MSGLWNRVSGPSDITGCTHAGNAIDSLIFLLELIEFILHFVIAHKFSTVPHNFCPALTEIHNIDIEGNQLFRFIKMNATD